MRRLRDQQFHADPDSVGSQPIQHTDIRTAAAAPQFPFCDLPEIITGNHSIDLAGCEGIGIRTVKNVGQTTHRFRALYFQPARTEFHDFNQCVPFVNGHDFCASVRHLPDIHEGLEFKTLFDIMEWEEGLKYRFRGQFVEQGDNKLMLFELDEPEMIKIEEIVLPPKEEEAEGKTVKQTIYIFPPEWVGTFGQPITSIAQVGILQQEHYAGNWDVLRPAAEIKEMNTFTADGLNALLHEAEEIMEGWTDTNE